MNASLTQQHCLFSAPYSFVPGLEEKYNRVLPTVFQEIWRREQVPYSTDFTVWVMNPGQNFIITEDVLDQLPGVRVLVTPSTGRNHIDLVVCQNRDIAVLSLLDDRPGLNSISASAEFTFLLLLNSLRRLDFAVGEVSEGRWRDREEKLRGHELSNKKVGLVGLGRIGSRMARYVQAFDAHPSYYDPYVENPNVHRFANLEALFSASDVVCICCTLTEETTGMIDRNLISRLRNGASLVNTSRGEVINESDLYRILQERPDLRVALDVLANEVRGTHLDSPLRRLHQNGQIVITPHIAGVSVESQEKAAMTALGLLERHYLKSGNL